MSRSSAAVRCRPAGWLYWPAAALSWLILKVFFGARFHCEPAVRKIKGPLLILGNHPSYIDPFIMAAALFPRRISFLASHGFFRQPALRFLLGKMAAIPKIQFRSDSQALKSMFQIIRSGGTLAIYPEGQRSLDGSRQTVDTAIAKLACKLGCPVALVIEEGGYLTWPRWSQSRWRRGRIDVRAQILFTPQQLAERDAETVQAQIEKALEYQDYVWQRRVRQPFIAPAPALGLHALCHKCPACGRDLAMRSGSADLTCRFCGNQVRLDPFGLLESAGIAPGFPAGTEAKCWSDPWQWHQWQLADMARRSEAPDFRLEFPAAIRRMADDGSVQPAGHGLLSLEQEYLRFTGDPADQPGAASLQLTVPLRIRNGISADYGQQFEMALAEGSFRFIPDDGQAVILIADAMTVLKKRLTIPGAALDN